MLTVLKIYECCSMSVEDSLKAFELGCFWSKAHVIFVKGDVHRIRDGQKWFLIIKKKRSSWSVVVHAYNPSIGWGRRKLSLRPIGAIKRVLGQIGLHSEILSQGSIRSNAGFCWSWGEQGTEWENVRKKIKSANLSTHCQIDPMKSYNFIHTFILVYPVTEQVENNQGESWVGNLECWQRQALVLSVAALIS